MKQIRYYRTYSYNEFNQLEVRNFETPELAKTDAILDQKNTYFNLYQIDMNFDGKITEVKKYLGQLVCGKDLRIKAEEEKQKNI